MSRPNSNTILIISGEVSGDNLGADLALHLQTALPNTRLVGVGANKMQQAGAEILINSEPLAVVGFTEIFGHLGTIIAAFNKIKRFLKKEKPKLVILIDYPGFNLRVAKMAHRLGIKVLYYVSPQLWAWRSGRIKTIQENVDHMVVLFPFEETLYQKAQVPVTFIGHPLSKAIKVEQDKASICQEFHLNAEQPIIGLLPGSRSKEIKHLLPIIINTANLLHKKIPHAQFVLPIADGVDKAALQQALPDYICTTEQRNYASISICDAIIACSGTATLEIALLEIPLVVIYKISSLSYWIIRQLIKVPYISLCNIVAGEKIAQEFIQQQATPENIATEILKLLNDPNYRQATLSKLQNVKHALADGPGPQQVAQIARGLLDAASSLI